MAQGRAIVRRSAPSSDSSLSHIWVQYGHALKKSGNIAEAENAYKKSIDLAPDAADTHLQLGHLYKTAREYSLAISAYRQALRADGSLLDARRELAHLGVTAEEPLQSKSPDQLRAPSTFIDLSDVFFYLRHHKTVSGIQRVQLGIANAIITMDSDHRRGISFLAETDDGRDYVIVNDFFVIELCKVLSGDNVEHAQLKELMASAGRLSMPYRPVPGDCLLILGAFWVLNNIAERIIALRRKGVSVGTLIHDIIPITHPEFCEKSLTDAFRSYFFIFSPSPAHSYGVRSLWKVRARVYGQICNPARTDKNAQAGP